MEKIIVGDKEFVGGALPQPEDLRDHSFRALAPFDWELGFDIELLLGYRKVCKDEAEFYGPRGKAGWGVDRYRQIVEFVKANNVAPFIMPVKDQGGSSSCTAQAIGYYVSVLNFLETGEWVDISARDIYAYISIGKNRGAYLRDACKRVVEPGAATEELVPSYNKVIGSQGQILAINPMSEDEYLAKPEVTEKIELIRKQLSAKEYKLINCTRVSRQEEMAWAMLLNFGAYFGVVGENNGTWNSEYPQVPSDIGWRHALFAGRAGLVNGKKTISIINSWSASIGIKGWQKLTDDYFLGLIGSTELVFDPWTLTDQPNEDKFMNENIKIIKDKNSSAVGFWIPATSPEALHSLGFTLGKEIPKKEDGTVDWPNTIEGELELK